MTDFLDHEVTWQLKDKLNSLQPSLPPGVKAEAVYDRTELVDYVIETVRKNLFEGGLLVVAIFCSCSWATSGRG